MCTVIVKSRHALEQYPKIKFRVRQSVRWLGHIPCLLGTRVSGGVINRQMLINIGNGVIRASSPEMLKELGVTVELTEGWTRNILKSLNWSKRRAATGKVEPSAQLLAQEIFFFQKTIAKAIQDDDVPLDLVINLDQTPLCYVSPEKCTFHFKGSKHKQLKGLMMSDKLRLHLV